MIGRPTLDRLDARWGDEYGVTPGWWAAGRVDVAPRPLEDGWQGLFVFRRGAACVVQGPPGLGAATARWIAGRPPDVLLDPSYWAGALGPRFASAVGPAWLGYTDAAAFRPAATDGVRPLDFEADAEALAALAAACGPTAWAHGGLAAGHGPAWGAFAEGELAAACQLAPWSGRIGHLGVITHPRFRGRGLGQAVVSAAAQAGLDQGLLVQYRTLAANAPSVGLATRLGFWPYATTLAIRLAEADEEP